MKSSVISVIVSIVFAAGCLLAANTLSDRNAREYTKLKIAVVNNDTSDSSALAVKLLTNSVKSLNAVLSMSVMEEDIAFDEIKNGNLNGILIIPDGAIEGYLYGNDIPMTLYISDASPYEHIMLKQIGETGRKMLSSGRSGTYTVQRIMYEKGNKDRYNEISDRINTVLLSKTLGAYSDMTIWKNVNLSGAIVPLIPHHILCFFAFFMLCSVSLWSKFILNDISPSVLQRMFCSKINPFEVIISKVIYIFLFNIIVTILFFLSSKFFSDYDIHINLLCITVTSLFLSTLSVFMFIVIGKNSSFIISSVSMIGIILSGGIIPVSLIPSTLANIGVFSPNRLIYVVLSTIYTNENNISYIMVMASFSILFVIVSTFYLKRKSLFKEEEI
ncbi:MAG: ABC transporter permease [Oscillospiraceae bacterium]|nr:ABC transporter permease [Oscillospiraceae bacterium]